jgi:hypothetical protein
VGDGGHAQAAASSGASRALAPEMNPADS